MRDKQHQKNPTNADLTRKETTELKRYKKYAKKKNVSVTKTTYEKYSYKGRNLKKQGVDNYYRVSNVYD